ncbi:MAG: NAD-dependent epimerase/dehydratase family protein [Azospirillum sp.]|nr:NAD-dependent epimerase/dehydratase family protein [Azospirillum sp.]
MAKPVAVVTGGAGFVGSHAVDLLVSRGYAVRVVDNLTGGRLANLDGHRANPDVTMDERDIRAVNPADALFAGADVALHFAGIGDIVPSIERPAEYMSVNVQGTVAVLEAARNARIRKFVYAASSSCYGLAAVPTSETAPIAPEYPYALSKYLGELATFHWARVYGLPANSIRLFNAYGPRSRTSGAYGAVFGVFLKQRLARKPLTIVGDGTQKRDFVFVTDVARGFLAAAETEISGEAFNIGAGDPQSVNRLAELIGGERTYIPKRPGEPDCTWADIAKARNLLGWRPLVAFSDGVAEVLRHIEYWRDAPLWDPESIRSATAVWFDRLGRKIARRGDGA